MQLHSTSGRWQLGLTLTLVTTVLWGLLPIALAIVLEVLDVYTLTWFRFVISFGLLLGFLAPKRQLPNLRSLGKIGLGLLAIAICSLCINYLLFLQGLVYTSPATAEVFIQLATVFFGLGAIAVFKERYTRRQWCGLGVLILGLILFFNEQLRNLITAPRIYLLGCGLIILASFSWAIYALAQKQLLRQLPSSNIMLVIYGTCSVLLTPIANPAKILSVSPWHWGMLIFCGLNTLIAYGSFAESLEHWEASRVSAVIAITPIVTLGAVMGLSTLFPALFMGEQFSRLAILGAVLVTLGSTTIALGQKT